MFVQLNFINSTSQTCSFKRTVNVNGICEYYFDDMPLTREEYGQHITQMKLTIQNFCAYQGKLEELCFKEGTELTNVFEEVSGSIAYKQKFDELKHKVFLTEEDIKSKTETLH